MKKNKYLFIISFIIINCVMLFLPVYSYGNEDYISTGIEYFPPTYLEDPDLGTYEDDVRVKIESFFIKFNLPLSFRYGNNFKTSFINNGRYEIKDFRFLNWPESQRVYDFKWLHALDYSLTVEQYFSKNIFIMAKGSVGSYSDKFGKFTDEDVVYKGAAAFGLDTAIGKFSAGIQKTTISGSLRYLPIITYRAEFLNKIYFDINAPEYGYVWYREDHVYLGIGAVVNGDVFNISEHDQLKNYKIKYSILTIGPVFKVTPAENFTLNLSSGWTIGKNRLEIYDKDDEKYLTYNLNETWFVRISIGYNNL